MAKSVKELRELRATLIQNAKVIVDAADSDQRPLTEEEKAQWDELTKEAEEVTDELETAERKEYTAALEEDLHRSIRRVAPHKPNVYRDHTNLAKLAVRNWLLQGSPHGRRITEEEFEAAKRCGFLLGDRFMQIQLRSDVPMGVGDATAGAEWVAPGFFAQLTEALKQFGGMLEVSDVINRETGADLLFPTANDTASVGEIVAEHAPVADAAKIPTADTEIKTHLYSSKPVVASWQFLTDSAFDAPAFIARSLGTRIGRILNTHLTTGDGSDKPHGVVTGAASGVVHSPSTGEIEYDDLVDLQDSVDEAYQANAAFMMSRQTLGKIRKILDGDDRPIVWASNDNLASGRQLTILGAPVVINGDMPAPTSGQKAVLYGDFKNYKVVQVQEVIVQRLDELYALKHQVGFLAFARYGGRLVNAGTNPVKYLQL